jgi:hypothetical protein
VKTGLALALCAGALLVMSLPLPSHARAQAYVPRYYLVHASQGAASDHVTFGAQRSTRLSVGKATVGPRGTDVLLRLRVPAINTVNGIVPKTRLALLVYGSNTGCPTTYRVADAMARSTRSFGFIGLISDAYVTADYGSGPTAFYRSGTFTLDVTTNTLLRAPSGRSPFSTACAMLYSGTPATLTPARNVAVERAHGPLVRGPGIPNNQP